MVKATQTVAASLALFVSASAGLAAEAGKCVPQGDDHRDTTFSFFDNAPTSHEWRVTVEAGGACSQMLYKFSNEKDPKTGVPLNKFTAIKPPHPVSLPGCPSPGPSNDFAGQVQVYCSILNGNEVRRWASVVIWIPGYYGAVYAVAGADHLTKGEPTLTGWGVDEIAHSPQVKITMTAEK